MTRRASKRQLDYIRSLRASVGEPDSDDMPLGMDGASAEIARLLQARMKLRAMAAPPSGRTPTANGQARYPRGAQAP